MTSKPNLECLRRAAALGSALFVYSGTMNSATAAGSSDQYFHRQAVFPVCSQLEKSCNTDEETAAEIVAASEDGMTLVYTDSPQNQIGFVNISDTKQPAGLGTLKLEGEPTSVAVKGNYALVAVNTSASYLDVSGQLAIVDITNQKLTKTYELGGQPDSIAVSPDGNYAAIAIENERDEDLGPGEPPQAPAGYLTIVKLLGQPDQWTLKPIPMDGLTDLYAEDPEPEYVDINDDNIAVITLQENNHIVLVDLEEAAVIKSFSAGTTSLTQVDVSESKPARIAQTDSIEAIAREPDGVSWISTEHFATADEGDLHGGSRGFTVFDTSGNILFTSGNDLEHKTAQFGHYPDKRSENKGNEPENIEFAHYGQTPIMVVASERSSLLFVYDVTDPNAPRYLQTLPAGVGPEGVLAIPSRNLLIAASEKDERKAKMRSVLNVYEFGNSAPDYPMLKSAKSSDGGTPIAWGALSGLAVSPEDDHQLYTVPDSFYGQSRIFEIDNSASPAVITAEIPLTDPDGVLASLDVPMIKDESSGIDAIERRDIFDSMDLGKLINSDATVNLDLEGISVSSDGGFWLVSEGKGTVGDYGSEDPKKKARPVESGNLLIKTTADGVINLAVTLPESLSSNQLRFGLEGVAEYQGKAYVAFQRAWNNEDHARIGIYDPASGQWEFLFYPLDEKESQAGGWVGLSDITSLGNGKFMVIERDNQGGPDAAIKRLYTFDTKGLKNGDLITKSLTFDVLSLLTNNGAVAAEKVEGLAVRKDGTVLIINDNDGVDDSNGETRLLSPGKIEQQT